MAAIDRHVAAAGEIGREGPPSAMGTLSVCALTELLATDAGQRQQVAVAVSR